MKRRHFIKSSVIVGSALYFGFPYISTGTGSNHIETTVKNIGDGLWVKISPDNHILIIVPSSEMGQGVHTSLAMVVAEEMDADWQKISVKTGSGASEYKQNFMIGQSTGGSTSVKHWWEPLKVIGAGVRNALLRAAAKKWNVDKSSLITENSRVIHQESNRSINYGELLDMEEVQEIDDDVKPKAPENYKLVGKPVKNIHNPDIITGSALYGIDTQPEGVLTACILHAPKIGAKLDSYDKAKALSIKGVQHVVPMDDKIAVVADGYWKASKGIKALNAKFTGGISLNSNDIFETLAENLDEEGKDSNKKAHQFLDVEYRVPYLAHTTMEPMNCTAHVTEKKCEVWIPTQGQTFALNAIEEITGLDDEQIVLHTTLMGGGFGRRAETDFVSEAVLISKAIKKPVKLIWSREEDVRHDYYRPASISRFQASIDDRGNVIKISNQLACPSILKRYMPAFVLAIIGDPTSVEGAEEIPYDFKHSFDYVRVDNEIPIGFWRSVGNSHNSFYVESFIDELAHAIQQDPLEFRLKHLTDDRHKIVLQKLKKMSGWGKNNGKHQGVAIQKSFGSIVGEVVELEKSGEQIKISKIYCVIDCGRYINPATIKDQVSGGVIYGLTAAIYGNITITGGAVDQSNFHDYPALMNYQTPDIEVLIVENNEEPGGVGEPGTPPVFPALANAVFSMTGQRIRELPLSKTVNFV